MAEDNTTQNVLLGLIIGSIATYLLLELNNTLKLFFIQSQLQNQYTTYQEPVQQSLSTTTEIQSPKIKMPRFQYSSTPIYSNDEDYDIERDEEGFVKKFHISREVKADL